MDLKTIVLILLNAGLIFLFVYLWKRKNLLSSFENGKWYLSWLAVATITLMDELTSIFYAPAEAHELLHHHNMAAYTAFFILFTSLVVRLLTTRMTEIARILEVKGIKGGGVYSFSYLVMGPTMSFIAVSSIFVDYILTACISTVSAVSNAFSLMPSINSSYATFGFELFIVWGVCLLNISGIKESAKFTFAIFTAAAIILLTLVASGIVDMPWQGWVNAGQSLTAAPKEIINNGISGIIRSISFIIVGVSSCILAYSGVESVIQTAGLLKSWKEIKKAYLFLGLTVGIVTPLLSFLVLSNPGVSVSEHTTDLMTFYAGYLNGPWFAIAVGALASFTLTMAVNTAYVASAELIERVAHRYGFHWIGHLNKRGSLYRVHLLNAALYTIVILITGGSQKVLAEMYAVGLVASFVINMGCLLYYRFKEGTNLTDSSGKAVQEEKYNTSRFGTLFLFLLLLGCLIYLSSTKPFGFGMWAIFTLVCLGIGLRYARRREPEKLERAKSDSPMEVILHLAEGDSQSVHLHFSRPQEELVVEKGRAYVTFYNPRQNTPQKVGSGHFVISLEQTPLPEAIREMIELIKYEMPGFDVTLHFGWPQSSWFDRMSIGVMVYRLMKLPSEYPNFNFKIEYNRKNV